VPVSVSVWTGGLQTFGLAKIIHWSKRTLQMLTETCCLNAATYKPSAEIFHQSIFESPLKLPFRGQFQIPSR